MANLNYPDYSRGFGGYGSYTPTPSTVESMGPSALHGALSYASPIASLAGIGLSAYGAYQQNKAIEEQNELAKQIFEQERRRGLRQDQIAEEDRVLNRNLGYGQYSQGEEDRALSQFGNYAQRIGL